MANNIRPAVGQSLSVFTSVARTATPDTEEFELPQGTRYATFVIDATAIAATPSIVFNVLGVDRLSGKTWTILASAAITGTGTTVIRVGPGLTAAANLVANDVISPVVRINAVHGDADSITYTMAGFFA